MNNTGDDGSVMADKGSSPGEGSVRCCPGTDGQGMSFLAAIRPHVT